MPEYNLDYKSNSKKSKEEAIQANDISTRKFNAVVTGEVKTKKNAVRKIIGAFLPDDIEGAKQMIFSDIIVPGIEDTILEALRAFFRRPKGRGSTNAGKVSYAGYYNSRNKENSGESSSGAKSAYDYEDLVFPTRSDAETVLDAMTDILERYKQVSVNDFYDLANVTNNNWAASKYGWEDLQNARIIRTTDGFVIKLPRPLPLD